MASSFNNIYQHGMARLASCAPCVHVADPAKNAEEILALMRRVHDADCALGLFPELALSAYAIDDLHLQASLLDAVDAALTRLVAASEALAPLFAVGGPLKVGGSLFNVAFVFQRGRLLGIVPKSYLPNYREYYEKRHFAAANAAQTDTAKAAGQTAPFGADLVFAASDIADFVAHFEICEDIWAPLPPSTFAAMAGATVLCNLSASNVTIGKNDERNMLCRAQSQRCIAAYAYATAGQGESTTDLAWDGHLAVFELGQLLEESDRFRSEPTLIAADVDLERIVQERMRVGTFRDCAVRNAGRVGAFRSISFDSGMARNREVPLARAVDRFPYVPNDPDRLDQDCFEAYNIQVQGLAQRLTSAGIKKAVIGVSGGLDSTQALLVTVRAFDRLGRPRSDIVAATMPGFATSAATKANAWALMRGLGVDAREIDIRPAAEQMLADLGHPYAAGEAQYDTTFENVQAGLRTDYLFRLANHEGGLVVGTGDLSELALGWCTYGVGDHMSHYNVNASLPKTLIQHLIRWCVASQAYDPEVAAALSAILGTEISPELIPSDGSGELQSTQEKIGPYELQDFTLYYLSRYGLRPSKVAFLAHHAWGDRERGSWPAGVADVDRREYRLDDIAHWLRLFLYRFFAISQFKRSAAPNAPKISSGGSLSPRGDWRAPSDSSPAPWLDELDAAFSAEMERLSD